MEQLTIILVGALGGCLGLGLGGLLGWRLAQQQQTAQRAATTEQLKLLASQALADNQQQFLQLAEASLNRQQQHHSEILGLKEQAVQQLIEPLANKLTQLDQLTRQSESGLRENLQQLRQTQDQLARETHKLAQALRAPHARGRWGEMLLRQTVEAAGMLANVSFSEQTHLVNEGSTQRPDMLINLPEERVVVIDAKAPLEAYLQAMDCEEPKQRRQFLADHASLVKKHINALRSRDYPKAIPGSANFTVLFLPGEDIFRGAIQADPSLLDYAMHNQIVLASPLSLLAMLKAVEYSWRQQKLTQHASEIAALGKNLFERLEKFADHLGGLQKHLAGAVGKYNETIASFSTRVMPAARRFGELQALSTQKLEQLQPLNENPRNLTGESQTDAYLTLSNESPKSAA